MLIPASPLPPPAPNQPLMLWRWCTWGFILHSPPPRTSPLWEADACGRESGHRGSGRAWSLAWQVLESQVPGPPLTVTCLLCSR